MVRQQQAAAGFSIADEIEKLDWRDGFAPTALLGPLAAPAVGVALLLNPDRSPVFIGRLVGAPLIVCVARSVFDVFRLARTSRPSV